MQYLKLDMYLEQKVIFVLVLKIVQIVMKRSVQSVIPDLSIHGNQGKTNITFCSRYISNFRYCIGISW